VPFLLLCIHLFLWKFLRLRFLQLFFAVVVVVAAAVVVAAVVVAVVAVVAVAAVAAAWLYQLSREMPFLLNFFNLAEIQEKNCKNFLKRKFFFLLPFANPMYARRFQR